MAVQAGQAYRIRLISMAAFAGLQFWIDGHTLQIIEVDSDYVVPYTIDAVPIGAAQIYSFLFTAKTTATLNYHANVAIDQVTLPANATYPLVTLPVIYNKAIQFAPAKTVPDQLYNLIKVK